MKSFKPFLATLFVLLLVLSSTVVFASSDNWVEVTRITRSVSGTIISEVFTIDYPDWRIR